MIVDELASSRVGESAGRGETDTPDCSWLRSGKSYEQALLGSERNGREKEKIPLDPLKRKREGKEKGRFTKSIRPSCAGAGASRARASAAVRRAVNAELDRAVAAFNGTSHDRSVWAGVAWRIGAENFAHAIDDKLKEDKSDTTVLRNPAAAFQAFLNDRFPKEGGAA